ncbi:hypothetical protein N7449_007987 [Penicillium cf. viridicatum]|uniref:Uncharacterized protein n=1 Tax=Penicillium cf. viridicatum TaxID=2972119 RepID=A0A9W9JIJ5_9EURO|nr:hypothetical protein N7449_007987 [Penicillium cf. viridicatum]
MGGNNNGVKSLRLGTSIHIKYDEVRSDRPEQMGSSIGPKGADHDEEAKELEAFMADNAKDINVMELRFQS